LARTAVATSGRFLKTGLDRFLRLALTFLFAIPADFLAVAQYLGRDQANISTTLSRLSARQTERR